MPKKKLIKETEQERSTDNRCQCDEPDCETGHGKQKCGNLSVFYLCGKCYRSEYGTIRGS